MMRRNDVTMARGAGAADIGRLYHDCGGNITTVKSLRPMTVNGFVGEQARVGYHHGIGRLAAALSVTPACIPTGAAVSSGTLCSSDPLHSSGASQSPGSRPTAASPRLGQTSHVHTASIAPDKASASSNVNTSSMPGYSPLAAESNVLVASACQANPGDSLKDKVLVASELVDGCASEVTSSPAAAHQSVSPAHSTGGQSQGLRGELIMTMMMMV